MRPRQAAWSIRPVGRAIAARHMPTRPETSPPEAWALRVSGDHVEGAGEGPQSQHAGWAAPGPGAERPDLHLSLAQLCPGPPSPQWPTARPLVQTPACGPTDAWHARCLFVSSGR